MLEGLSLSPITLVVLVVFIVTFLIQAAYYLFAFSRLGFGERRNGAVKDTQEPVSIIICARNESKNLRKYLESVLQQDYPKFEVIVVNDCSFDDSEEFLKEMSTKYTHLKVVSIVEQEKYQHGKKFALTLGIKATQYEQLLLTDADCLINSNNWISRMQQRFVNETDIVLSYGAYQKRNNMLNKLIRFDCFYAAMQYLSFAIIGRTYMGVGRNLAYRKELFFKNKGFANHYHLMSGDDDLFINEVSTPTNTAVELNPEAYTSSEPKETFKTWFRQKKRHVTTSKMYRPKDKMLLGGLVGSHMLFYICLFTLLILRLDWEITLSVFGLRMLMQYIIMGQGMSTLKEKDLIVYIPLLDFFVVIFYPILAISNAFSPIKRWK